MIKLFNSPADAHRAVPQGSMRLVIIDGEKITLAHTESGLHAFANACPHQREPLHKGRLTPFGEVVCPLHHYRFNPLTGQEANNRCPALSTYTLATNEQGVFIRLTKGK